MSVRKYLSLFLIILTSTIVFVGCDDDDDNVVTPTPKARVLVVHASPDAPAVDLLVDNAVAGTGLTYPNNTGYLEVNSGTRNVKVNLAGTNTTVFEASPALEANVSYSVFAANVAASLEPVVFVDDLSAPATGKAHVRFIHLAPDAPAVDITTTSGTPVFSNVSFKQGSAFIPLDAGTYDLQVRLAGTSTVVLELTGVPVQQGKIYTVFAKGLAGGTGVQALGAEVIVNK